MITDHISRLDADDRLTLFEMTLCDPEAGELVREYIEVFPRYRSCSHDGAMLELFAWIILARQACGMEGFGHA